MDIKKFPVLGGIVSWLEDNNLEYGYIALGVAVVILFTFFANTEQSFGAVLSLLFLTAPLWFTYIAAEVAHYKWLDMIGKSFNLSAGRTTLEIKLPQEVFKSPRAMETALQQMWSTANPDNYWETYLKGKRPPIYSLEIVSNGGEVKFYINCQTKKFKNIVEAQLYAQYPGIEIHEPAVDYTAEVVWDPEKIQLFAGHINKKRDHVMPIGTYIDQGLDDMPKEEEKTDPMTVWIDHLAHMTRHEKFWIQILIKGYKEKSFLDGGWIWSTPKNETYDAQMGLKVDELMHRDPKTKSAPLESDGQPRLTLEERSRADALERKKSKYQFATAMRYLYIADKEHFNPTRNTAHNRIFSAHDIKGRNELGVRWRTDFNYHWFADPFGDRLDAYKASELKEYKLRKYNNKTPSDKDNWRNFSTEEIATLFHIPGKVALAPTLSRIPSTKSEAPANLPTGVN